MPTVALSTGSLYNYGIARVFELAAEAGFDAIEVLVDHRWDSRHPTYLQRLCREIGLPIAVIHSPFVLDAPGWPNDPMGRLRESTALARQLGARVVVTHLPLRIRGIRIEFFGFQTGSLMMPIPMSYQRDYRDFLLNGLAEFESAAGVQIGVENMPAKHLLGRRVNLYHLNQIDLLAHFPHLTLDTTHIGTWGIDLLSVYEMLRERIVHVHLSNFDGKEHRRPEDGRLPLAELLRRLRRDSYRGAVTLELGPDVLQAEDEGQVRAHLRNLVAFCREHLDG